MSRSVGEVNAAVDGTATRALNDRKRLEIALGDGESYLTHFGFAQQNVRGLRFARHPVANIDLVVHRDARAAKQRARECEDRRDANPKEESISCAHPSRH
jgi:hypothetical protein